MSISTPDFFSVLYCFFSLNLSCDNYRRKLGTQPFNVQKKRKGIEKQIVIFNFVLFVAHIIYNFGNG